jgi:hypothetical protein
MKRLIEDSAGAGSVGDSAGAGSVGGDSTTANSVGAGTSWITVRNCLLSMKDKVADVVADRRNVCW